MILSLALEILWIVPCVALFRVLFFVQQSAERTSAPKQAGDETSDTTAMLINTCATLINTDHFFEQYSFNIAYCR